MPPYLETIKVISSIYLFFVILERYSLNLKSFAEVPITDAGVDTVEFLLASEGLVGMFGMLIY